MPRRVASIVIGAAALLPLLAAAAMFVEVRPVPAPARPLGMVYSPEYQSLVLRNSGSEVIALRVAAGTAATRLSNAQFTDVALAPSGRYVFASDWGGDPWAYQPPPPNYVHRLDLATGLWEVRSAYAAGHVQAISDTQLLLMSRQQWVTFTNNQWGTGTALDVINATNDPAMAPGWNALAYYGDFRYVPWSGRILHGNYGSSSREISAFRLSSGNFIAQETSGIYGSAQDYGGSVVLASDASAFYYGALQVDPMDVGRNVRVFPEIIYAASGTTAFGEKAFYDVASGGRLGTLGFPSTVYALSAAGDELWAYDAASEQLRHFVTPVPDGAVVVTNPYGAMTVTGAQFDGRRLSQVGDNVVVELGPGSGAPDSIAEIAFDRFPVAAGQSLTIRSGAAGQHVYVSDTSAGSSVVAGMLRAEGGNGAPPPRIHLRNPNGIVVPTNGTITAQGGLVLDATHPDPALAGGAVEVHGQADGGPALSVRGQRIGGGGSFKGNAITLSTPGNANNPISPVDFLANGLQLMPGSGANVDVRVNPYGKREQFINVRVLGNATLSMPSVWPAGTGLPPNALPFLPDETVPSILVTQGGSMIFQATGTLRLLPGATDDLMFRGALVLKSEGDLDVNSVLVDNGWTAAGQAFQGVFFEAPRIRSTGGRIDVFTNHLNWVNFSTLPEGKVTTWQFDSTPGLRFGFVNADAVAPHINVYSTITAIAAAGGCWICAVNTTPFVP